MPLRRVLLTTLLSIAAANAAAVDCGTPRFAWSPKAVTGIHNWSELASVDGDAHPDLIVARINSHIGLHRGTGTGFLSQTQVHAASDVYDLAVADFTNDGRADIVTANTAAMTVTLLRGNGDATFTAVPATTLTFAPWGGVASGDFDGDGKRDLVVSGSSTDKVVALLKGDGAGGFAEVWRTTTTSAPLDPVAGDFDADGSLDFAVSMSSSTTINVAWGNGSGGFTVAALETPVAPGRMLGADVNGDGRSDLLAFTAALRVHLAGASRTFGAATTYNSCGSTVGGAPAIGDVTRDGIADVVAASQTQGWIVVWPGNGSGGFGAAQCSAVASGTTTGILLTDLDADGQNDVLTALWNNGVAMWGGVNVCGKTTITIPKPAAMPVAGDDVSLEVRVEPRIFNAPNPTGTVVLKEGAAIVGQASLVNGIATIAVNDITAGAHQYTAIYDGDDGYFANQGTGTVDAAAAESTITITGPAESTYGQTALVTVTVQGSNGLSNSRFEHTLGCGTLDGEQGFFNFRGCGGGAYSLVVRYAGSVGTPRGASAPFAHTVRKATPSLNVSNPPAQIGTTTSSAVAAWTASISSDSGSPTGTFSLTRSGTTLESKPVAAQATLTTTLPIGTYNGFRIVYGGDANFEPVESAPHNVTVYYNGPATLKASWSSGQVTFQYLLPHGTASTHFYRRRVDTGFVTEVPPTGEAMSSGVHLYWYTAHDANGMTIATTGKDVVVAMPFTDETLTTSSVVKAVHFQDVLAATNLLRAAAGLSATTLETLTPGVTTIRGSHLTTLRDAINQGRIVAGADPYPFTDTPLGTSRRIRLLHMLELRDALR